MNHTWYIEQKYWTSRSFELFQDWIPLVFKNFYETEMCCSDRRKFPLVLRISTFNGFQTVFAVVDVIGYIFFTYRVIGGITRFFFTWSRNDEKCHKFLSEILLNPDRCDERVHHAWCYYYYFIFTLMVKWFYKNGNEGKQYDFVVQCYRIK